MSINYSDKPEKKLMATFQTDRGTKKVYFGASGIDDYTKTGDVDQRQRYRLRHAKDLLGDPSKPGYLSYYILWGDSTSIKTNIEAYKKKFKF